MSEEQIIEGRFVETPQTEEVEVEVEMEASAPEESAPEAEQEGTKEKSG